MTKYRSTRQLRPPPKRQSRPSASAFQAATARLDLINSLAHNRHIPAIIDLSDSESGSQNESRESSQSANITESGKKQPLLQTPIRHALLAAPDSGYASGQTRRAKRPVVLDSEDEDSLPDRAKRSAGSKHEQTSRIMTFEDLGIDLNIWGLAEGIASNTGYTKRQSPIKSPSREAPYYIPAAIKPRRKLPSLHNQHNYSNVDGQTYAQITAVRPPAAMRQTGQVKARANTYYHRLAYGFPYKQYDKRLDSNYHPIRDPDHDIHRNCDVPLPSVEDAYAGTERTKSCKSQR